ncbi:unnamed protein product [Larinioides sclopetarius]|uniref:Uncharacterized protein n=1 Tax=Larinioides sclopetarius TaxID=280406 RepID=A0AAV2BUP9_9ARAC
MKNPILVMYAIIVFLRKVI